MKKLKLLLSIVLAISFASFWISCDDEKPAALNLISLMAGSIDLNGATSAVDVPTGSTMTAEFSTAVDETTSSAITLTRKYDNTVLPATIAVNEKTITIDPDDDLGTGTLYELKFQTGLKSSGGTLLKEAITRTFTTEGTFAAPGAIAQWTFENNADDVIGTFDPTSSQVVDITYGPSHNEVSGKAAIFNGTTSIIEISNGDALTETTDFSLSFWVKPETHSDDANKGHFVMGLGAFYGFQFEIFGGYSGWKMPVGYEYNKDGTTGWFAENNSFNGDGKNKDNGGWRGFIYTKDLTTVGGVKAMIENKWVNIVFVYNGTTKRGYYYANGEKMREFDFNLWLNDAGEKYNEAYTTGLKYNGTAPDVINDLVFGFPHSRAGTLWDAEPWGGYEMTSANHLKGSLDDVTIYQRPLTAAEVTLMYNSGKPE